MNARELISDIVTNYKRHGWQLQRVLLGPETRDARSLIGEIAGPGVRIEDSKVDGLWFSRSSYEDREAWELRLIAETPYALLETFGANDSQESRESVMRELETRLSEYAG